MLIPFLSVGQSKIRNTQITSGNQPNETFLKSDGATNAVWDSAKISGLKIDTTLNLKEYSIIAEGQQLPLSNGGCQISSIIDNGDGTVTLGSGDYHLSANVSGKGSHNYTLTGGTFTLTDQSQNYIVADYNNGSPYIHVITDVTLINETTIVPIYSIYRNGNFLHTQNWDALGLALSNKIHQSIVKTQRYRRESGLALSEYPSHYLALTTGRIWTGAVPITLDAIATSTDNLFFFRHVAGVWTPNIQTTYNFTHYDNGTDLIELTSNRYAVNWIFRGVESQKYLYIVAGTGDYTESQATAATLPAIPVAISSHAVLVAKLIVQKNAATASSIQSAFDVQFGLSTIQSHGDLTGRDVVDSHPAGAITNTPYSTTSSISTQGAINELTDEKENISNKENTTVDNSTTKYPTVNLLKTYAAPISGSANYVQVSPSSAQTGNIWIGGTTKSNNLISTSGSNSFVARSGGDIGTYGAGISDYPVRAFEDYGWNFTIPTNSGVGKYTIRNADGSIIHFKVDESGDATFFKNMYLNAFDGAVLGINNFTTGQTVHFRYGGDVNNEIENTFGGVAKFKAYHGTEFYSNIGRIGKIGGTSDKNITFDGLSGTGTRIITADSDGILSALGNGIEGQVVKVVGGVPAFADESGGGIDESGMTANFIQKWDGTKFVDWINPRPQTLTASLTTVWDVNSGIDANMTMTGDASITLQNLKVSTSGTLHITKQSVNRRLKIKGYTLSISRNIEWDSTGILITGNSKEDSYTWTYNGVVLTINGNKDYNQTSF